MAKVYCLKVTEAFKTITLRHVLPIKTMSNLGANSEENIVLMDLAGNCFARKPSAGIIIGGYFIREAGTELPGESEIRY